MQPGGQLYELFRQRTRRFIAFFDDTVVVPRKMPQQAEYRGARDSINLHCKCIFSETFTLAAVCFTCALKYSASFPGKIGKDETSASRWPVKKRRSARAMRMCSGLTSGSRWMVSPDALHVK